MKYNPKIYHRRSIRLKEYDYSQCGYYYITVCTKNMECWFGNVVGGEMKLSDIGEIVKKCWVEIPQQFGTSIANSLPMIVNHFKSAVKRWCNKNNREYFQWHRNYYEHIIRNEIALNRIREYIINNPLKSHLSNTKNFY